MLLNQLKTNHNHHWWYSLLPLVIVTTLWVIMTPSLFAQETTAVATIQTGFQLVDIDGDGIREPFRASVSLFEDGSACGSAKIDGTVYTFETGALADDHAGTYAILWTSEANAHFTIHPTPQSAGLEEELIWTVDGNQANAIYEFVVPGSIIFNDDF